MSKLDTLKVGNEEELKTWFDRSESMLLLFDVHRNWSDRCEILLPHFEAMCIKYDQINERMAFISIEVPKYADCFRAMIKTSDNNIGYSGTVNDGKSENDNEGGNSFKDPIETKTGCLPLFIAVKSRKIIAIVEGADFPSLAKIVHEHIPELPETEVEVALKD